MNFNPPVLATPSPFRTRAYDQTGDCTIDLLSSSSLKLVYIFSVNPHLGPLQVSLSRMVMDIMKFFFLYVLVLFAFSCGKSLPFPLSFSPHFF